MAERYGGFIWYELMSSDLGRAKRFYDAVVGWAIAEDPVAPGLDYHMIGRADGGQAGGVMVLSAEMRRNGARPSWVGYLHVEDVDRVAAEIAQDGGAVLLQPWDQPGVGRLAMIADPDGVPVYLMSPQPPADQPDEGSDVFSVDLPQHVRWNELTTRDSDGAVAFYQRHFGWLQQGDMDMGPAGKYRFFYRGDAMIGAVMPCMSPDTQPHWTYYFGVEDIDRAAATVAASGGRVSSGPQQIPGGEYALEAVDPEDATFGLVGPRLA